MSGTGVSGTGVSGTATVELYDLWFDNPQLWFSSSKKTSNKYLEDNFDKWVEHYSDCEATIKNYISIIILYDQVTRNINKNNNVYDAKARYYANKLKDITNNYNYLSSIEWCFAMLPYRHTKNAIIIHTVISDTWERMNNYSTDKDDIEVYKKFIKASYERCPTDNVSSNKVLVTSYYPNTFNNAWDITLETEFTGILEYNPKNRAKLDYTYRDYDKITKSFSDILNIEKPRHIIISLSGGVDSMISSLILRRFKHKYGYTLDAVHINYANRETCKQEEIILQKWCAYLEIPLHIREIYEINRGKCMKYELRNIYESYTRDVRYNTYKYVYNNIINTYNTANTSNTVNTANTYSVGRMSDSDGGSNKRRSIDSNGSGKSVGSVRSVRSVRSARSGGSTGSGCRGSGILEMPFVVLGHNYDDVCENILTNIAQQSKYNVLTGMEKVYPCDNIKFVRPMLDIKKSEIYTFSRENSVPHLPNSTPAWSQRGKIRDIVKPAFERWHSNIFTGLLTLSATLKDLYEMLDIQVDRAVKETIEDSRLSAWTVSINEMPAKYIFWQAYIHKITGSQISLKSAMFLQSKIEKFKEDFTTKNKREPIKMPLSKTIFIAFKFVKKSNNIVVAFIY